jgi:hypothetical protein
MQALIDFDGWRKWKDFSQTAPSTTKATATPIPPQLLNNSSGSTVASLQSLDSPVDSPKKEFTRGPPRRLAESGLGGRGDGGLNGRGESGLNGRGESGLSGRGESGLSGGREKELVAVRTGRKAKRSSLPGAGALSGVVEDSGEWEGEKGGVNGV